MGAFVIQPDDPEAADVRALLREHLAFAHQHSPPEDVHALDISGLLNVNVSFFGVRENGVLVGIGALKQLDEFHAEIKSMHTAHSARRRGVGRALLDHLIAAARARGCRRVSLETGAMAAFAPARGLYASSGFAICEPFAGYTLSRHSVCMTLALDQRRPP